MKKIYIVPTVKVIGIKKSVPLLAGSITRGRIDGSTTITYGGGYANNDDYDW